MAPDFAIQSPHIIVFANEKGGTGKSTTAVHIAVALSMLGHKVSGIDLDPRQRTFYRYLENRADTMKRRDIALPIPQFAVFESDSVAALDEMGARLGKNADFLIYDTPGRDDVYARHVAVQAHTLVTPINDSFVDFDLIGQVDPETFKVKRLSFYAELIWEARKTRAKGGREMDWTVLRNRTQNQDARNQKRLDIALTELSRRVGFRVVPGLSERVIYRELFPSGLTLLDKGHLGNLGTSHVLARQELRTMLSSFNLPDVQKPASLRRPEMAA